MGTHEKTITIHASVSTIQAVLVEVARIADWNPAISPIAADDAPAAVGKAYRTLVRNVVPAEFTYTEISAGAVAHTLTFPGFREDASWLLSAAGSDTRVTHRFSQSGPASRLIPAGSSDVVSLRLSRLKNRSEQPSSTD